MSIRCDRWDCCIQFASMWKSPDLSRDLRMDPEDEADEAKSRVEKPYLQWVKPHLEALITLAFSTTCTSIILLLLKLILDFSLTYKIKLSSDTHADYMLSKYYVHDLQVNPLDSPLWYHCYHPNFRHEKTDIWKYFSDFPKVTQLESPVTINFQLKTFTLGLILSESKVLDYFLYLHYILKVKIEWLSLS